jgi:hypothetical protein
VTMKTAGSQTLFATDTITASITGVQTVTISPAAAATLQVAGLAAGTAGVAQTASVTAKDAFNNTATGYMGTVHFTSTDSQALLPADYTFVVADNGVHGGFGVSLKTAGSQTLAATDTVTNIITGSQTVTISPAAAATVTVSGLSSGTAGVAQTATVIARDAFNNTATGYLGTVHFTSNDGQAMLPADYTFVAGDSGIRAGFSVTLKTAGSPTLTATDTVTGSITGSQTVAISPSAATTLQVTGLSAGTAGVAQTATVTAKDAFNNAATGYLGTVHFTSSDSQALLPADYAFVGGDNGVHGGFSVTLKTSGSQPLMATDTVTSSITGSQTVTISAAAAVSLQVSGLSSGTAGEVQTATVTAKDAFNNTATGYTGTVHFTSTDGQAVVPANYGFVAGDSGVHLFSVALKTAATQSVTVTDTVTGSLTATQSGLVISPAAGATLQVTGLSSGTAGVAQTATVIAKDAFNNTASGYVGTVAFSSSDVQALLPANYTFVAGDNGMHAGFSVTLKTAGSQTVTATDTVTASITGSQTATISPAAASTLQLSGLSSGTAGVAQTGMTVTAKDAFSNTATGYTGMVHFTSSDGQAVLPADYGFVAGDNGVHVFSVTLKTAAIQSVTVTDTVTASLTASQSGLVVSPAAASTLQVTGLSASTAGVVQTATVTAKDAFGNTATAYLGTVHFTSTDSQAVLPGNYTFVGGDNGVHGGFSVTLKTAGSQTLTATDNITGSITGGQTVTISPAAATNLVFTTTAQSTKINVASGTITVQQQDAFGNAVNASADVAVTLSSTSLTGTFLQTDGTTPLVGPMIPSGSSSLSFTYKDTLVGTPTITAHAAGFTDGTQMETVTL